MALRMWGKGEEISVGKGKDFGSWPSYTPSAAALTVALVSCTSRTTVLVDPAADSRPNDSVSWAEDPSFPQREITTLREARRPVSVAKRIGLNNKLRSSLERPGRLYASDSPAFAWQE